VGTRRIRSPKGHALEVEREIPSALKAFTRILVEAATNDRAQNAGSSIQAVNSKSQTTLAAHLKLTKN
jgi:hypothetical protein